MAYATTAQIERDFKDITFSSSTSVTDTDVAAFIEEADAEIDANLADKYEVPITGAAALIVVRTISIAIVADRIRGILTIKTGDEKKDQAQGKSASEIARQRLKDIRDGKIKLVGATLAQSSDGIKSYATDEDLEPIFSMDEDQW